MQLGVVIPCIDTPATGGPVWYYLGFRQADPTAPNALLMEVQRTAAGAWAPVSTADQNYEPRPPSLSCSGAPLGHAAFMAWKAANAARYARWHADQLRYHHLPTAQRHAEAVSYVLPTGGTGNDNEPPPANNPPPAPPPPSSGGILPTIDWRHLGPYVALAAAGYLFINRKRKHGT